ncbi:MAG: hypothetical protein V4714_01690 [Bacteroidota bacterium]
MQTVANPPTQKILESRLEKSGGYFTLTDAASATGLPVEDARRALDTLMSKYVCRLKVTENGDLIYDFGKQPLRRGEKTQEERIQEVKDALWKAFTVFYKVWITVTLVVYFVIFLLLLIAMIVAMTASNKDNDRKSSRGSSFGSLHVFFNIFSSLFRWNTHSRSIYYERDEHGYPYQHYQPTPSAFSKTENTPQENKGFVASVYDFVFGPPRVEISPLANQQEAAAYLRQQKGIVVVPELKALAGWNSEEAETFFSDCVVRFNGQPVISSNGVLYGDFYELNRSVNTSNDTRIVWYWDEYEPEYELTGNTSGRNTLIAFLNGFNLVFALLSLNGFFAPLIGSSALITIGLGLVPILFSFIFFLVPAIRYFNIQKYQRQQRIHNIRKRLMKVIFLNRDKAISLETITQAVNSKSEEEALSKEAVEKTMKDLLNDFAGEVELTNDGKMVYRFPKLQYEMQEVTTLRQKRIEGKDLGNVVFDVGH